MINQFLGEQANKFGFRAGCRYIESVQAHKEEFFLANSIFVADGVCRDDDFPFLTLEPFNRIDCISD